MRSKDVDTQMIPNNRGAGILLHITSLPSSYGIGDFGPEAILFADFLYSSGQKYWQILPINATDISPYSAISAYAGNILLISPELLAEQGLLHQDDILKLALPKTEQIDFEKVHQLKSLLLSKAFERFREIEHGLLSKSFYNYCKNESHWLDDFAFFIVLKRIYNYLPWYSWPEKYNSRNKPELDLFASAHAEALLEVKWQQYIFHTQWNKLKYYCNEKGISIIGDLPIYVSHDSVDVWANPDIFSLDENGKVETVAGVPPDYFSSEGQLWGMPTYKWEILKDQNYSWWMQRIKKNISLFDLIRLDHFRAFASYWSVDAKEITAINGSWKPGPGSDFFKAVKKQIGYLPFIAEDLGEIDETVIALRDKWMLPGMKVLQFAFGNDMPTSVHIPHNYTPDFVVYTGTHDNNTTLGWLRQEAGKTERSNLSKYSHKKAAKATVNKTMAILAYASVARLCILPMQDILDLDETFRMNTPGTTNGNWFWRLKPDYASKDLEKKLKKWVKLYNR